MHNHFQAKVATQDVLANQSGSIGFFYRPLKLSSCEGQFASYINEGCRNVAGVAGDNDAFDQLMRVLLHQPAIFEGTRLTLVCITAEVAGFVILRKESPLHAVGKACSAT